jgi:hypothetical protein
MTVVDPHRREVHFQIMWNRLVSILEEQARTLVRTAFSTSVREAGDLSAGLFDRQGRMVAQAVTGTPGHVNTMAAAVPHFIDDIGADQIRPGDVYLTNDPWKGTGLGPRRVLRRNCPCGRHRRARVQPRCPRGLRGGNPDPDHAVGRPG